MSGKVKILLLISLLIFCNANMRADASFNKDSLMIVLSKLSDSSQLKLMDTWSHEHLSRDFSKDYIDMLYIKSKQLNNKWFIGEAYYLYSYYYYDGNWDSMHYYTDKAAPILLHYGRKEELCRIISWNIISMIDRGNTGSVLFEIQNMKDLTKKLKYQDGTDIANQCLAYFYVFSGFKVEAVKLYEEILQDMYKRNVPLRRRIYLLRQLLNNTEGEKHNYYVNILYDYIKECETKGIKKLDDTYTLEVMKVLYYNNKSNTAYKNKDANEMRHYITLSEQLIKQYNLIEEDDDITLLRFQYYYLCKNYSKALQEGEILLNSYKKKEELQKYMFVLNIKNDILYKTNKKDDALIGYKNYAALKDSFSCTEFYKYLASFRSQRDFDNLKLTNQALKIEASHDHFQMSMLRFSIGSLIFICLIMGIALWLFHRSSIQSKKAQIKAEEADRMKTIFLDNMNHEIRTPLNAIIGFSQILIEENNQESRQEYADIILKNNDLLQRLIGDVLDFSRIESNSIKFSNENVNLRPLMEDLYKTTLLRMPKEVKLIFKDSENICIFTDPIRLIQIFSNLLNNAMKHTKQGYIQFGYIKENTLVHFFVEDTGEGIPEDKIEYIFKRFTKLNPFDKGVGLGLAICKGLLDKMGGDISVTSTLGKGSTFSFTLPVSKSNSTNNPVS